MQRRSCEMSEAKWSITEAKCLQISHNKYASQRDATLRPRQIVDIQYDTTIMGGREVSRPYRVWFFAEGERFLSFWRCHRPRWGGRR